MNIPKNSVKLIATADLHLGTPQSEKNEDQVERLPAHTWRKIIKNCISQESDMLLIAGDLIDQEADFAMISTELDHGLAALENNGIDVVVITGNHDYDLLPFYLGTRTFDNVTLLGANGNWESIIIKKRGIRFSIAGRSFPEAGDSGAPMLEAEEVFDSAQRPVIGMLHCDTKIPESIFGYVEMERLIELDPAVWILGHIHEPELLHHDPPILYTGSPAPENQAENKQSYMVMLQIDEKGLNHWSWMEMEIRSG